MGWIVEFAIDAVAQLFGEAVARKKPWWVELLASIGCLVVLGLIVLAFWFLFVFLRP